MTDNTYRLTVIMIAAVALIGLGCAAAVANTSSLGTNMTEKTADDNSTQSYYYGSGASQPATAHRLTADEISMLTSNLGDAKTFCESATMALGQFSFAMPQKAVRALEIPYEEVGVELSEIDEAREGCDELLKNVEIEEYDIKADVKNEEEFDKGKDNDNDPIVDEIKITNEDVLKFEKKVGKK